MKTDEYYKKRSNYKIGSARLERILRLLPSEAKSVLDIGCSEGELASVLKSKGMVVSGADISPNALAEAKEFLDQSYCFDIQDKQWPAGLMAKKFDLVIASEVIEHIFDPVDFLKKASNLLNPNGRLIITTPNFLFWKHRIKFLFGNFKYEKQGPFDFGHIRFFNFQSLKDTFESARLSIEREENFYPNLYRRGFGFLGRIYPGLFAYQFIALLSRQK